jgi:hypothetical protein
MAKDEHNKAVEHHENAAKVHRAAAEHHSRGDEGQGAREQRRTALADCKPAQRSGSFEEPAAEIARRERPGPSPAFQFPHRGWSGERTA